MKVAVINYSGSVGKTLISSYLLAPRLTGAKFYDPTHVIWTQA